MRNRSASAIKGAGFDEAGATSARAKPGGEALRAMVAALPGIASPHDVEAVMERPPVPAVPSAVALTLAIERERSAALLAITPTGAEEEFRAAVARGDTVEAYWEPLAVPAIERAMQWMWDGTPRVSETIKGVEVMPLLR